MKRKKISDLQIDESNINNILIDSQKNDDGIFKKIWRCLKRLVRGTLLAVLVAG
jgi:hypothetical protein